MFLQRLKTILISVPMNNFAAMASMSSRSQVELPAAMLTNKATILIKATAAVLMSAVVFAAHGDLPIATEQQAIPVVIKGVVATSSDKQQLLDKLQAQYPNQPVRDELEVRANISIPTNWQQVASAIIDSDIAAIRQGRIDIHGTLISLHGKVDSEAQRQTIQNRIHSRLTDLYQLDNQLVVTKDEQQLIDQTLDDRIIEFESGSATLTPMGLQILDDMASALQRVGDKPVTIIGHTDNVGNPSANLMLSNQRAEAVKQYLIGRGIAASRLSTAGKGDRNPMANNDTVEGRMRNRRIEFTVGD